MNASIRSIATTKRALLAAAVAAAMLCSAIGLGSVAHAQTTNGTTDSYQMSGWNNGGGNGNNNWGNGNGNWNHNSGGNNWGNHGWNNNNWYGGWGGLYSYPTYTYGYGNCTSWYWNGYTWVQYYTYSTYGCYGYY